MIIGIVFIVVCVLVALIWFAIQKEIRQEEHNNEARRSLHERVIDILPNKKENGDDT